MQRVRRVLQLRLRALQHLDRARRARARSAAHVLQRVDGAAGERVGARRRPRRSRRARRRAASMQRLRVREARVLGVELVPLVGAGRELVDLADLPGEPLALALSVVLLRARVVERLRAPRASAAQAAASGAASTPA